MEERTSSPPRAPEKHGEASPCTPVPTDVIKDVMADCQPFLVTYCDHSQCYALMGPLLHACLSRIKCITMHNKHMSLLRPVHAVSVASKEAFPLNVPSRWDDQPYVQLYLLHAQTESDITRRESKIKEWITQRERCSQAYLVVLVVRLEEVGEVDSGGVVAASPSDGGGVFPNSVNSPPKRDPIIGTSSPSSGFFGRRRSVSRRMSSLLSTIGLHASQTCIINVPPEACNSVTDVSVAHQESLQAALTAALSWGIRLRIHRFKEEIKSVDAMVRLPGWNIGTYIATKQALARVYQGLGLWHKVLVLYDELELLLEIEAARCRDSQAMQPESLGYDANLLHLDRVPYERIISNSTVSDFDLRHCVFAWQITALFHMHQAGKVVLRANRFKRKYGALLRARERSGQLAPHSCHVWSFCMIECVYKLVQHMLSAKPCDGCTHPPSAHMALGDLCNSMRAVLGKLGDAFHYATLSPITRRLVDTDGQGNDDDDDDDDDDGDVVGDDDDGDRVAQGDGATRVPLSAKEQLVQMDRSNFVTDANVVPTLLRGHVQLRRALVSVADFSHMFEQLCDDAVALYRRSGMLGSVRSRHECSLRLHLGELYWKQRRYAEAETLLKAVVHRYASGGWTLIESHVLQMLGECQRELGHNVEFLGTCLRLLAPESGASDAERRLFLDALVALCHDSDVDATTTTSIVRPMDNLVHVSLMHAQRKGSMMVVTVPYRSMVSSSSDVIVRATQDDMDAHQHLHHHANTDSGEVMLCVNVHNRLGHRVTFDSMCIVLSLIRSMRSSGDREVVLRWDRPFVFEPGSNQVQLPLRLSEPGTYFVVKYGLSLAKLTLLDVQDSSCECIVSRPVMMSSDASERTTSELSLEVSPGQVLFRHQTELLRVMLLSKNDTVARGCLTLVASDGSNGEPGGHSVVHSTVTDVALHPSLYVHDIAPSATATSGEQPQRSIRLLSDSSVEVCNIGSWELVELWIPVHVDAITSGRIDIQLEYMCSHCESSHFWRQKLIPIRIVEAFEWRNLALQCGKDVYVQSLLWASSHERRISLVNHHVVHPSSWQLVTDFQQSAEDLSAAQREQQDGESLFSDGQGLRGEGGSKGGGAFDALLSIGNDVRQACSPPNVIPFASFVCRLIPAAASPTGSPSYRITDGSRSSRGIATDDRGWHGHRRARSTDMSSMQGALSRSVPDAAASWHGRLTGSHRVRPHRRRISDVVPEAPPLQPLGTLASMLLGPLSPPPSVASSDSGSESASPSPITSPRSPSSSFSLLRPWIEGLVGVLPAAFRPSDDTTQRLGETPQALCQLLVRFRASGGPKRSRVYTFAVPLALDPRSRLVTMQQLSPSAVHMTHVFASLPPTKWLLSHNWLGGGAGSRWLARALVTRASSLVTLNVSHNGLGCAGVRTLAAALPHCPQLRSLDVSSNNVRCDGAAAVVGTVLLLPCLQHLDLGRNPVWATCDHDASPASPPSPTHMVVGQSPPTHDIGSKAPDGATCPAVRSLAHVLRTCAWLRSLRLWDTCAHAGVGHTLCTALRHNNTLTHLELGLNPLGDVGVSRLHDVLAGPSAALQRLGLAACDMTEVGLSHVAIGLSSCASLAHLDVSHNVGLNQGFGSLAQALANNAHLTRLELRGCDVTIQAMAELAMALQGHYALVHLCLDNGLRVQDPAAVTGEAPSSPWNSSAKAQAVSPGASPAKASPAYSLSGPASPVSLASSPVPLSASVDVDELASPASPRLPGPMQPYWAAIEAHVKRNQSFALQVRRGTGIFSAVGARLRGVPTSVLAGALLSVVVLDDNELTSLPADVSCLSNVHSFSACHNQLSSWDHCAAMTALQVLKLSHNALVDIPRSVTCLRSLHYLELSNNAITSIPEHIGALRQLYKLHLDHNQLDGALAHVTSLRSLRALQVSHNHLTALPGDLGCMTSLEDLNVSHNRLASIPVSITRIGLVRFDVTGNPLHLLPPQVVQKGSDAVLAFMADLLSGESQNRRMKLMFTGQENVGKTTLLSALRNEVGYVSKMRRFLTGRARRVSTDGIDLGEWCPSDASELIFSTWDFGGQQVYYTTHQFFLSQRSLYLVVFNMSVPLQTNRLISWLNSIQSRAPGVPVILVGTHADHRRCKPDYVARMAVDVRRTIVSWQKAFPRDQRIVIHTASDDCWFHCVSCLGGQGVPELREALVCVALAQPSLQERIPMLYLELLENLRRRMADTTTAVTSPIVPWRTFVEWSGFDDLHQLQRATQLLHDWGELVHFDQEPGLRDLVVLQPQWLVDMLATVITYNASDRSSVSKSASPVAALRSLGMSATSLGAHPLPLSSDDRRRRLLSTSMPALTHVTSSTKATTAAKTSTPTPSLAHCEDAEPASVSPPSLTSSPVPSQDDASDASSPLPVAFPPLSASPQAGILHPADVARIWRAYPSHLHPFLEELLERFQVWISLRPHADALLVPALLPTAQPVGWPWRWDMVNFGRCITFPFELHGFFSRLLVKVLQFCEPVAQWQHEAIVRRHTAVALLQWVPTADSANPLAQRLRIYVHGPSPPRLLTQLAFVVHTFVQDWYNRSLREKVSQWVPCIPCTQACDGDAGVHEWAMDYVMEHCVRGGHSVSPCATCGSEPATAALLPEIIDPIDMGVDYEAVVQELAFVGEGASSIVYQGLWQERVIAVKKLRVRDVSVHDFADFCKEVATMRELRHVNVLKLYHAFLAPLALIMEFGPHGTLHDLLLTLKTPNHHWHLLCRVALDVCEGMAHLHAQDPPLMHRDLKSMNVLMFSSDPTADVVAKIGDLGSACLSVGQVSGSAIGNPRWKPPEVIRGQSVTLACDVYAFGLLLYEMVARRIPFADEAWEKMIEERILHGERPIVPEDVDAPLPEWKAAMERCWHQEPGIRPSFEDLVHEIKALLPLARESSVGMDVLILPVPSAQPPH